MFAEFHALGQDIKFMLIFQKKKKLKNFFISKPYTLKIKGYV